MKRLFTILSFTAAIGFHANAQYDIGCSAVNSPVNGDTIYSNTAMIDPNYTRKNFGATVPAAVPIMMRFKIDGVQIDSVARPSSAGDFSADETRRIGRTIDFNANSLTTGNHSFCVVAYTANDNDRSNDETCINFYYSSTPGNLDLSAANVSVTAPVAKNGNEYGTDETLETIAFTLKNVGSVKIASGITVPITVAVGTDINSNITYTTQAEFKPGDSLNLTASRSTIATLPNFPTTLGNFDVRVAPNLSGDVDPNNNIGSATYKMVAGTTPTVASFTPTNGKCKDVITITGTNFSTTPSGNTVKFGLGTATVLTATATQLTVETPPAGGGIVSVTVNVGGVNKKGESTGSFTHNGCDAPSGLDELSNNIDKIYYSNGNVKIELNNSSNAGEKLVQVMNVSGQVVASKVINVSSNGSSLETLDISSMPNGMYLVNIEGYTKTIMK